jgi:hypothetical protein
VVEAVASSRVVVVVPEDSWQTLLTVLLQPTTQLLSVLVELLAFLV